MEALRRTVKQAGGSAVLRALPPRVDAGLLHVEGRTKEGFATVRIFSTASRKFFANCCTNRACHNSLLEGQMQRAFPPCSFLTPGAASWI